MFAPADFVIPRCATAHRGCATWRSPGIHNPIGGYGFRTCARSLSSGRPEAGPVGSGSGTRLRSPGQQPQPFIFQLLLLVADAVDSTGPVVGDEDRTILGDNDIGRPAEIILVTLKPA